MNFGLELCGVEHFLYPELTGGLLRKRAAQSGLPVLVLRPGAAAEPPDEITPLVPHASP